MNLRASVKVIDETIVCIFLFFICIIMNLLLLYSIWFLVLWCAYGALTVYNHAFLFAFYLIVTSWHKIRDSILFRHTGHESTWLCGKKQQKYTGSALRFCSVAFRKVLKDVPITIAILGMSPKMLGLALASMQINALIWYHVFKVV